MRKILLFVALLCIFLTGAEANILRVGIDYADLNTAQTAAAVGDTLQIYGTQSGTISKRLVLIGFGYNFDVHPGLQAIGSESPSNLTITMQPGADSSIVEGMDITTYIYCNKVIVERCRGAVYLYNVNSPVNDIKIIACVLTGGGMGYANYPCSNLQVYNSLILSTINMSRASGGTGTSGAFINCAMGSPTIYGNSEYLVFGSGSFLVKNCILLGSGGSNPNTVYESNFFSGAQPAQIQGSNDHWGLVWANLFNRLGGTIDDPSYYAYASFDENYFILKTGSAAINSGTDGSGNPTDAGIFGGDAIYRYRASGVPPVPAVYNIQVANSAATTNPYNVTISVRSNN